MGSALVLAAGVWLLTIPRRRRSTPFPNVGGRRQHGQSGGEEEESETWHLHGRTPTRSQNKPAATGRASFELDQPGNG